MQQVGDRIGKGAYGTVYRGLNTEIGEVVALKQFDLLNVGKDDMDSLTVSVTLL